MTLIGGVSLINAHCLRAALWVPKVMCRWESLCMLKSKSHLLSSLQVIIPHLTESYTSQVTREWEWPIGGGRLPQSWPLPPLLHPGWSTREGCAILHPQVFPCLHRTHHPVGQGQGLISNCSGPMTRQSNEIFFCALAVWKSLCAKANFVYEVLGNVQVTRKCPRSEQMHDLLSPHPHPSLSSSPRASPSHTSLILLLLTLSLNDMKEMKRHSAPDGVVRVVKLIKNRPADFAGCVAVARIKFEKYFNRKVLQCVCWSAR